MDWKKFGDELTRFEGSAAQVSILIVTLVLYLLTKSAFFGILVALEFIFFVALEVREGVRSHGVRYEIFDTLRSLGIAVLIWLAVSVILRTSVPVSAVVSCSMLPNLQRGDLTIIHGTAAAELRAPEISVSTADMAKIYSPEAEVYSPYGNLAVNGSMFSYCQHFQFVDPLCANFFSSPSDFVEKRGPLTFRYSQCQRRVLGSNRLVLEPCVTSIEYSGKSYGASFANDVIVYQPNQGDLFSYTGDIIHRVYLRISSEGRNYVLTKGDNNNIFDVQFYDYNNRLANTPVQEKNIRGANLFAVPYVGYFKLFISGFVSEPPYCNTNLLY